MLAQPFILPTDPAIWALVAAVLATGYIYVKARRQTRKDPFKGPPPAFGSPSSQRRVENQMNELLVELEKMSRQMSASLDTRSAKLEELIRQADERLAQLDAKLEELRGMEGRGGGGGGERHHSLRLPPAGSHGSAEPISREELPPEPIPMDLPQHSIPIDPRHAAIYRLADQGRTSIEISREINQPPGEIELILALRRGPARTR